MGSFVVRPSVLGYALQIDLFLAAMTETSRMTTSDNGRDRRLRYDTDRWFQTTHGERRAACSKSRLLTDGGHDPTADRPDASEMQSLECKSCGTPLLPDSMYCRSCGIESPFPSRKHRAADETLSAGSNGGQSTAISSPVPTTAQRLLDDRSFDSEIAERLCSLLAAPSATEAQVEATLKAAVDALEFAESGFSEVSKGLENRQERSRVSGPSLVSIATELERTMRPESDQSRELLAALANPESERTDAVLRSTVRELDASAMFRRTLTEIEPRDVRRRLDALETDLDREGGGVYRHLADRVRELEAMLDRSDRNDVRLYAIYQESTFYDRTLLPQLSRSEPTDTVDIERLRTDIRSRLETIENEYIGTRTDHNHAIPRHFLSLAVALCDEAQRLQQEQPERAVGVLTATDDLLTAIENLYDRNEFSVMLRRLRG